MLVIILLLWSGLRAVVFACNTVDCIGLHIGRHIHT
jgi:hypothetical protein